MLNFGAHFYFLCALSFLLRLALARRRSFGRFFLLLGLFRHNLTFFLLKFMIFFFFDLLFDLFLLFFLYPNHTPFNLFLSVPFCQLHFPLHDRIDNRILCFLHLSLISLIHLHKTLSFLHSILQYFDPFSLLCHFLLLLYLLSYELFVLSLDCDIHNAFT